MERGGVYFLCRFIKILQYLNQNVMSAVGLLASINAARTFDQPLMKQTIAEFLNVKLLVYNVFSKKC